MTINGIDLYHEHYTGDGTARVFLNGIGMSVSHWNPVRAALKPGTDILHDFRDQLRSSKVSEPYTMQSHAEELKLMLDKLGVERAHLIGTSYGAEVALIFAIDYPDRCASVVSIDGVSESDARLKAAVASWKSAALSDPRVFYRSLIPWNYSADYIARNTTQLAEREELVAALPRDYFEGFARLCDAFLGLDITGRLPRVQCPTLVLVAEHDILKTERYSRIIHEQIAGSTLETIPGAGHAVVIEDPEEVAMRIQSFLDDAEPTLRPSSR